MRTFIKSSALSLLILLFAGSLYAQLAIQIGGFPAADTVQYCSGGTITPTGNLALSIPAGYGSIQWAYIDSSGTAISPEVSLGMGLNQVFGGTTPNTPEPKPAGYYTFRVQADNGGGLEHDTIVLHIPGGLTASLSSTDRLRFCTGQQALLQVATTGTAIGGIVSYEWYTEDGGRLDGAADMTEYAATASGKYYCRIQMDGGCEYSSDTLTLDVASPSSLADVTVNVTTVDEKSFCLGGQALLTATVREGDTDKSGTIATYVWKLDGTEFNPGFSQASVEVTEPGLYTVEVTDTFNCSKSSPSNTSSSVRIERLPSPAEVVIVLNADGKTLELDGTTDYVTYQWYLEGTRLVFGTGRSREALQSGVYQLEVTNSSGCSRTSQGYCYNADTRELCGVVAAPAPAAHTTIVDVYPNPASSQLQLLLDVPEHLKGEARIQLVNLAGQTLLSRTADTRASSTHVLDVQTLPAGVYHALVTTGETRTAVRVVIQR